MTTQQFTFENINHPPDADDMKVLVDGMLSYHASKGHQRKTETYSVLIKDDNKKLLGAVIVSFLWNGMHIDSIWIHDSIRKQGWGRKLMGLVEAEGVKRGCSIAYTDTFTWQAPQFYEKLGYDVYGKLEGFPEGNSLTYYSKKLKNE